MEKNWNNQNKKEEKSRESGGNKKKENRGGKWTEKEQGRRENVFIVEVLGILSVIVKIEKVGERRDQHRGPQINLKY